VSGVRAQTRPNIGEHDFDLATLLNDPARAAEVLLEAVPGLLALIAAQQAQLAALQAALTVRLVAPGNGRHEPDRLLTLDEAAQRLATTPDWLRRQDKLPFRVEVSPGQVRYSAQGILHFIARRAAG
jgi:hypothetical protein